ncbi:MAG TPA: pitrilysin family protein [Bacilli bacterium]|nr:MAG: putative zinc protease AlbF [Tenericutes bacterium ADurb.BinA124]HOH18077.1 pitrilysin family protein [Bacilli bacterium]HPN60963.1 pitrilysin family protein [Bacilli bacterium]HPX84773.1 pitrilysin family protein [Bacilli bacterium]
MIKEYPFFDEQIYQQQLTNGLQLIFIPKNGFKRSFVFFASHYGAAMNRFIPKGEKAYWDAPLGIAHFLEHQLFTMPDGQDASELLAKLGLDSNAFTNYSLTGYLFNGSDNILKGLTLLLDFVQTPHFTEKNVLKEQGIIAQELKMFLDRPGDALHYGLMQNMFFEYPLKHDVGGTLASIKDITAAHLRTCYRTFYQPANMTIIIVGDLNNIFKQEASFSDLVDFVSEHQKTKKFGKTTEIIVDYPQEPDFVRTNYDEKTMEITVPRAAVGLKIPFANLDFNQSMLLELRLKILLEANFGTSTDVYQEMLDQALIQSGIATEVYHDGKTGYVKISANTEQPQAFVKFVQERLLSLSQFQLDLLTFERFKKALIGNFIRALNSFEFLAVGYLEYQYRNSNLFAALQMSEDLTLEDLSSVQKYFTEDKLTSFIIFPNQSSLSKKASLE